IWFGTNQGGELFDGMNFLVGVSPHWSGINSTAFDSNGDPWFASPLGGITHFDGTTFTVYDTSNGLLSQNVTALLIDNQDNKWIGTGSGMSVLNASNTSFTHHTRMYIMPPPDTLNPVVDIAMDSYGRIWAAIYVGYLAEGGIAYWDGNQWEDFHVSDGLVGPNVRGLAIDSEDNVWVATSTGVSKISSISTSTSPASIANVEVFPNPSSGVITVSFDENFKYIEVYNILGSLIHSEKTNSLNEVELNLSHLSSGIYHLVLTSENLVLNQKIIIE
ncbi:MAG TPA: T9SS type A sorting domain-containing protein, partial [Flavobacteriales bacterium]|nr:T9SS type A sorting domain-containing protein [Flavobacteriales bacterium]